MTLSTGNWISDIRLAIGALALVAAGFMGGALMVAGWFNMHINREPVMELVIEHSALLGADQVSMLCYAENGQTVRVVEDLE